MATVEETRERSASAGERWYALDQAEVPGRLGVVLDSGLSADEAAERLRRDGPNALPVEEPPSALTAFDADIFNSSRMNVIVAAEVAGAFLITQADFMQRLLGTTRLTAAQWGFAFLAAVVLLLGWEAGKWIARRRSRAQRATVPAR